MDVTLRFPEQLGVPLLAGFSEVLQDSLLRTETQNGMQRTRLRNVAPILNVTVRYRFTPEQYAAWLNFFTGRCARFGNRPFIMNLPIRGHAQDVVVKILQQSELEKEPGPAFFYSVIELVLQVTDFVNAPVTFSGTVMMDGVATDVVIGEDSEIEEFVDDFSSATSLIYIAGRDVMAP